ncbi:MULTISPECIES: 3-isopropylmalate dehydratase small subunit [Peribacillus]|jgi:3-isopropylmalate/(R)-2-methylmalate dehydratase small subunit|uniref:3-isopropylmalate dehydratase small subunit n=1 Tax=Peribacillus TaxID=2675229 RepID=UPI00207A5AC0|nr:3-isopropylmalate dehydratase small subunit [Peribacillus asahii]USK59000.1 3-isopropylmalate dehydratase small subunit [Peribacillus asahii]
MEPIKVFTGKAAVMDRKNVDTDQIIPKQFLKRIERSGFGQFLFFNWRFDEEGNDRADFELNQEQNKGASILIAGENFGCGSSREHAPWALLDYGFNIVIAPSFADIFRNNCMKNGIVPIVLTEEQVAELMKKGVEPGYELTIDLPNQKLFDQSGFEAEFEFHPYWKEMLINGWDEISITEQYEEQIKSYEQQKMPISSI